jgi:hypothetical protein
MLHFRSWVCFDFLFAPPSSALAASPRFEARATGGAELLDNTCPLGFRRRPARPVAFPFGAGAASSSSDSDESSADGGDSVALLPFAAVELTVGI